MVKEIKKVSHIADNELTHSMVHYLLTVHKLKEKKGYARVTDIAKEMKITKGSVSIALNNLRKKEFIVEDDDKFLSLSEKGHEQVHSILTSRTLLYYFLKDFLGVSEETSHKDSCLMEHLMSEETRNRFFHFMKKLSLEGKIELLDESTHLNFENYDSYTDFTNAQEGDAHLTFYKCPRRK